MVTIPSPQTGGFTKLPKPPVSRPGAGTPNPYQNPAPRPSTVDYATPSIYQTNTPYKGLPSTPTIPGGGTAGHGQNPNPPTNPNASQASSFITPAATPAPTPVQPITPNAIGQFSLTEGSSPFNIQQNQQLATTTGVAGKAPVSATVSATKSKPKPKHKSALDKYLGKDSDYQNTIRDLTRALTDFKARQGVEKTRAGTEYGYAQRTMGNQSKQDLSDIQNDAAARGIVTSGVYGQRVGDYNTTYNEQLAELGRQYKSQLDDFASALKDFSRQQNLQKEAARTAAIRRRAAKLGKVG